MAAGCTAYLTKPIKQDVLLQAIVEHTMAVTAISKAENVGKETILVDADPKFADLIPAFLQNRRLDVVALLGALDQGDFATVERLGHGMRGTGGSYGFATITDIGGALEEAAIRTDNDGARKWVSELTQYLDRVEVVVR